MIIENFAEHHLGAAVALIINNMRIQMEEAPSLDPFILDRGELKKMLSDCLGGQGVAAIKNGELVGFMTGFYLDGLLGPGRGILVPEWGHAIEEGQHTRLYKMLYRAASEKWVKQNALTHVVITLNCDAETRDTLSWNGFGMVCVDAARFVKEFEVKKDDAISVNRIDGVDIKEWLPMVTEHYRHILQAPVFKPDFDLPLESDLADMLKEEGNLAWMARVEGKPAGYIKIAPREDGAAWIVNGQNRFAVNGAYILPEFRGSGIASLLLNTVMAWGEENGFTRCSVDFESANPEASAFWLKYFQPVCRAMIRRIDPRVATRTIE